MMNNPTSTQWEQAILNKLTNNGERIAVIEKDLSEVKEVTKQIRALLGWLKWIGGGVAAILLSLVANFLYSFVS